MNLRMNHWKHDSNRLRKKKKIQLLHTTVGLEKRRGKIVSGSKWIHVTLTELLAPTNWTLIGIYSDATLRSYCKSLVGRTVVPIVRFMGGWARSKPLDANIRELKNDMVNKNSFLKNEIHTSNSSSLVFVVVSRVK